MDFFHGIPGPEDVSDLAILARASILHERTVTHINLARAGSSEQLSLPETPLNLTDDVLKLKLWNCRPLLHEP